MKSLEEIKKDNLDRINKIRTMNIADDNIFLFYMYTGELYYAIGNNFNEAVENYMISNSCTKEMHDEWFNNIMYFHRGSNIKFEWINEQRLVGWQMINSNALHQVIQTQQRELNNLNFKLKKNEDYLFTFAKHFLTLTDNPNLKEEVIKRSSNIINAWQKKYGTKE